VHSGNYFNYSADRADALHLSTAAAPSLSRSPIKNYVRSDYQPRGTHPSGVVSHRVSFGRGIMEKDAAGT